MCFLASFCGPVEFAPGFAPRPQVSHVLFDFDGTLSLIHEGWPQVMIHQLGTTGEASVGQMRELLFGSATG